MAWILVSRTALVTKCEGRSGMVVDSVELLMFKVYSYRVLVEGDIMRNKVFVWLVDCSGIDRRTESR